MRKSLFLSFFALLVSCCTLFSQSYTQTIRGTLLDKDNHQPLIGAVVVILKTEPALMAATDEEGKFKIQDVPVGRYDIRITYMGYREILLPNIIVNSGKETILNLEMSESVLNTKEVTVKATKGKEKANNEMATVSARTFSIDESNRYAGSIGDPARMAANFAGVSAPNDSRNDIIIRGNSPAGLLWRLEGIDIPSPNHFSAQGTTGGPVSILNNNTLANSDFFTGAWPAEYGNSSSGVFDLKMRTGNNEKYEETGQFGFNGFEFMTEGPFSRKRGSSFMASYRYSALGLFQAAGINFGPSGTPYYQDLSFKLNFPLGKKAKLEMFGIGGISTIALLDSKKKPENLSYGQSLKDIYFGSQMGVFGMTYTQMIGSNSYWKTVAAGTYEGHTIHIDSLSEDFSIKTDFYRENAFFYRLPVHSYYNWKINAANTLRVGGIFTLMKFDLLQKGFKNIPNGLSFWQIFNDSKGSTSLGQGYANFRHDFNEKLSLIGGMQFEQFFLNNSYSIEPRAGLKYRLNTRQTLSAGYGMHGQVQPLMIYFFKTKLDDGSIAQTNKNIGFSRAQHFILAYDNMITNDLRLKLETYYQYLDKVPVTKESSSYSVLNFGADYGVALESNLINSGSGQNKGVELTLEKFFSHNYYFLFTTSVFDSKYQGSDGVLRNTAFNSVFTINGLLGKDFKLTKNNTLTCNGKVTYSGGRRYTPADIPTSILAGTIRTDDAQAFAKQFNPYFKSDVRIGFKMNRKRYTQEWAVDVQNVTNQKNVLSQVWDPKSKSVKDEYQLGVFPTALYRIQF